MAKREFQNLKADLMRFKTNKVGTNLDRTNAEVRSKVSAFQLQRQKFINQMKNSKLRENETLSRLADFTQKIKTQGESASSWLGH